MNVHGPIVIGAYDGILKKNNTEVVISCFYPKNLKIRSIFISETQYWEVGKTHLKWQVELIPPFSAESRINTSTLGSIPIIGFWACLCRQTGLPMSADRLALRFNTFYSIGIKNWWRKLNYLKY